MKKELPRVSFLGIYRITTLPNNFWRGHCYEETFVKKCNKPLLQVSETKIIEQEKFLKIFFQSQREKQFRRLENKSGNVLIANIKQTFAVKLPPSSSSCLHCYIIL